MPGQQLARADVTVVVPAFNEGARVATVVSGLLMHFGRVVVVDDGSSDQTGNFAHAAGAHVVRHPGNLGQGAALQTGFAYALADPGMRHVITFDSDGQHRVEDALSLLEVAHESGVDVVLGSRFLRPGAEVPAARRAVLRAIRPRSWLAWAMSDSVRSICSTAWRLSTRRPLWVSVTASRVVARVKAMPARSTARRAAGTSAPGRRNLEPSTTSTPDS
jgi:glycosyltransferase involved in cell wall biosynthesis